MSDLQARGHGDFIPLFDTIEATRWDIGQNKAMIAAKFNDRLSRANDRALARDQPGDNAIDRRDEAAIVIDPAQIGNRRLSVRECRFKRSQFTIDNPSFRLERLQILNTVILVLKRSRMLVKREVAPVEERFEFLARSACKLLAMLRNGYHGIDDLAADP